MDIDTTLLEAEEAMDKALKHVHHELKGIRTGRANPAIVESVKVEAYGTQSDLKSLARIAAPESTQILVTPFDPSTANSIAKGIEAAGLGLNPTVDGKVVRVTIPPLTGDRRKQLAASVKKIGEEGKVQVRNARRDANKHIDALGKDKDQHLSEDQLADAKDRVQELVKQYEAKIDEATNQKAREIEEV